MVEEKATGAIGNMTSKTETGIAADMETSQIVAVVIIMINRVIKTAAEETQEAVITIPDMVKVVKAFDQMMIKTISHTHLGLDNNHKKVSQTGIPLLTNLIAIHATGIRKAARKAIVPNMRNGVSAEVTAA